MRFVEASDQSLLVEFEGGISLDTHHQVVRLLRALEQNKLAGIRNLHPAYCSVLIVFDPLIVDPEQIEEQIRQIDLDLIPTPVPRLIKIPVHYDGPDLGAVAAYHGIAEQRVIELHSSALFTVYFLGFVPGFAYMGGLPEEIATPRRESPRKQVPAGSVGIAGTQTGVYPFATPGGWQLIGRTELEMFRPDRREMNLLCIGDQVRFTPA
jgi:KipI family sensor histidine kinase inhibitor